MSDIKFGVTYSERADFTDLPAYAKKVEELGFDSIWVTENIGSGAPALECFTALSFMAAHTSKLMLGPSVMLLPLRNPVMVAQTVASLDILSGGRVVLGVGVGNESPDFAAYGGNARERASRSDEALEVIKRLWTEDSVTFHGKHFNLDGYQLLPKPVQKPHPRIHVGGGAVSVVRRAGRFADSLIPVSKTPAEAKAMFESAEETARASGRDASAMTRVMHLFLCFSGSAVESAEIASGVFTRRYGSSTVVPADAPHLLGTPERMKEMLQAFIDVGVTEFVMNVVCPPEEGISQADRFAKEVMVGFRYGVIQLGWGFGFVCWEGVGDGRRWLGTAPFLCCGSYDAPRQGRRSACGLISRLPLCGLWPCIRWTWAWTVRATRSEPDSGGWLHRIKAGRRLVQRPAWSLLQA